MSRLSRYTQKLFGSSAGTNQIAEFGSLAASSPQRYSGATVTPANIQALGNYLSGWVAAQIGAGNPAIEDMNALDYLWSYQLAYMLQLGIPEWDLGTTYYVGSIAQDGAGNVYRSLQNTNLNNVLTDGTYWSPIITNAIPNLSTSASFSLAGSSGSYVSVTDITTTPISATITSYRKPVRVALQSDGTTGGAINFDIASASIGKRGSFDIQIIRNGSTVVANTGGLIMSQVANTGIHQYLNYSGWDFTDFTAPAGTNTYTMTARQQDLDSALSTLNLTVEGLKLSAYEG